MRKFLRTALGPLVLLIAPVMVPVLALVLVPGQIGPLAADDQGADKPADAPARSAADNDRRVAELIEQLGAPQYATRERAQSELRRMGLAAFDALHSAQYHSDIEVALRARYLVKSMRVTWWRDTDDPEVKKILKSYGQQDEAERENRMDKLAGLTEGRGVDSLCRLVRFETSMVLSKHAALLVMNLESPQEPESRGKLAKQISDNVGLSKRPASDWLRAYAKTMVEPESQLVQWSQLAAEEQQTLAQFPSKSSREILRDLLRWQAELLVRLGRRDEAVAVIRATIDAVEGNREQLLDIVDWLMVREEWSLVDEVNARFPDQFSGDAQLLYRLAEAQLKQGKRDEAEKSAATALKIAPGSSDEHILVAFLLQERGLLEWAEREYRHALSITEAGSLDDMRTRFLFSEMLHDHLKDDEAAKVLKVVVDAMDSSEPVKKRVARFNREPGSVRSRMHYFFALHHDSKGEREKQKEQLRLGVKEDPTDADLLIAMHRLPDSDKTWKAETQKHIDEAAKKFKTQIDTFLAQADGAPEEQFREFANRQLATAHNQYAWLIGNTDGDYDEAIKSSHRSLELRPNSAGYLDTLGRCYYAKGDLENAIKYQSQAVKLEPHSGAIRRQLEKFKAETAKKKKSAS